MRKDTRCQTNAWENYLWLPIICGLYHDITLNSCRQMVYPEVKWNNDNLDINWALQPCASRRVGTTSCCNNLKVLKNFRDPFQIWIIRWKFWEVKMLKQKVILFLVGYNSYECIFISINNVHTVAQIYNNSIYMKHYNWIQLVDFEHWRPMIISVTIMFLYSMTSSFVSWRHYVW